MFCHDFIVMSVNDPKIMFTLMVSGYSIINYFWRTEGVTTSPCVTRLMNFSEKVWQHDILTTWSHDKNIYEEVMTKHIRWSHDKNIYEEVLTKHVRWNHDKTCTMKSWQDRIWEMSWQNIYEEVLTKHIRWNHDKTYTFMFDKTFTMKFWQSIYDEIMTKH